MKKRSNSKGNSNTGISYSITRIELIESSIKLPENTPLGQASDFRFSIGINYHARKKSNQFTINVNYSFLLKDSDPVIFHIVVETEFYISNLKDLIVDSKFINRGFLTYVSDIAVDHARGIQATLIAGTPISKFYMPVLVLDKINNQVTQLD